MERLLVMLGWCLVAALASWLRFDDLGDRPFHADEATGARITATRMSGEGGGFDPKHYHGPLLGDLASILCRVQGQDSWEEMTKRGMRIVPAVCGLLVVLLPAFWRRSIGDAGALCAGVLLAVSPLLVYYSRMFIHEMLLVLAGGGVLACFAGKKPHFVAAGIFLGLMFAIKETFVISVLAWGVAFVATMWVGGGWRKRQGVENWVRENIRELGWMMGAAILVSMFWYTRLMTNPAGAWHAIQTFFVYETVEGHDKAWWWYVVSFGRPLKEVQRWWIECLVLWVAMLGFLASFLRAGEKDKARLWIHFLGFSILGHILIYSLFGYKTPWLMCLPWLQVCLLAGFGVRLLSAARWQWGMVCLIAGGLAFPLFKLSVFSSGRFSSDGRNPYAYVPTRKDIERVKEFLNQLRPLSDQDAIAVVGSDYWPLPWYLRSFDRAGYWSDPPQGLESSPFVMALPDSASEVMEQLGESHTVVPRGLRDEVPVWLLVRNDIWTRWMEAE